MFNRKCKCICQHKINELKDKIHTLQLQNNAYEHMVNDYRNLYQVGLEKYVLNESEKKEDKNV